jgi:hypothetical protein
MFWLRLSQALRAGYVLFGPWKVVLGIWIGVAVAAGFSRGAQLPLWVLGTVAGGAALRHAACRGVNFLLRRKAGTALPWTFLTPLSRCRQEASAALESESVSMTPAAIGGELAAIEASVAKLVLDPAPPPLLQPGLALPAWFGVLVGWSFVMMLLVAGHWSPQRENPQELDPKAAAALAIEKAMLAAPASEKLTPDEYFYSDPQKLPKRWNVAKPAAAPAIPVARVKPATADDVATALIDGQRLLLPYKQSSVDALIAVPIGENAGSGLMLYDGRNRRVITREVLLPAQLPSEKSWFEVDKLKVFYAGTPPPPPPPPQKTVVDPQKPVDTLDLSEREIRRGAYQAVPQAAEQKATNAQPLSEALDTMSP